MPPRTHRAPGVPPPGRRGMLRAMANAAPVTLIVGDEEFLADRAVRAVVAAVRAEDPGAEVHDLQGARWSPGS